MASVGPANPAASGPTAPMTPTQLRALSSTPAQTPIPPAALAAALSTAPFVTPTTVPGTFNLRDLGLVPGSPVRPGCIFRSGMLVGMLRPETGGVGPRRLRDELGVATVYDLRSARERNETPGPDLEAVGVRGVWVKTEVEETPLRPEDFVGAEGGKRGWAKNYLEILYIYRKGWADVVRGLARTEGKGDAVLVHCTAGRDRTGVLCALIHSLAGASPETVLFDYMLSRIGYEPAREQLVAYAMAHTKAGAAFARGSDSSNSSGDSDANVDIDDREIGFTNIIELRPENWDFFVAEVDRVYGRFDTSGRGRGWWGYALASHDDGGMGLTKDEIEAVRRRLTEA